MSLIIETFFNWLARASWQAAVLVLIVGLVQWMFGKKLSARWRHAFWLLVVARLLLPAAPQSALSLFNYAGLQNVQAKTASLNSAVPSTPDLRAMSNDGPAGQPLLSSAVNQPLPANTFNSPATIVPTPRAATSRPSAIAGIVLNRKQILRLGALGWALGALLLALRVILQNLAFVRRLRAATPVAEPTTLALFEQCKGLLEIRFTVGLVETTHVNSPALHGYFRPCLLLPAQMVGGFSRQELRYIFLHELAHVKRRDMAVHWAAALLKILHWFNPVLWLGFRRMATDRELACDELALSCAGEQERKPYGAAIIKVLETCASSPALPGVMGILEDKDQMTRRISMILKFKQRSRWSVLAILLLLALALFTLTDARSGSESPNAQSAPSSGNSENTKRPDLIGRVQATNGAPVEATVFIYTAGPKVGTSTFCPSCYADCRKRAKADIQGNFKIESMDPQLLFRILVVAQGYEPKFVGKVDPASGPFEIKLKPSDAANAGPERTLRGRILDAKGNPVEGAVVNSHGIRRKNGGATWGTLTGVDPLAVTDKYGDFLITALEPFESMDVQVEVRAFANKTFTKLASGTSRHDLVLPEGVTVIGRVMFKGQPLTNVSVGIVSVDRGMENFTGNFDIGVGADGRFSFMNLPANVDYYIYGLMNTVKAYGAIQAVKIHSADDGGTTDAGDLVVGPAYRLAGRVVLADGQAIPPKTRLLVDRQEAWDTMQIELAKDGSFDTTGIPAGLLGLSVRVPGYAIAPKNASLDLLNPYRLIGRVDHDTTNLVLLLVKGKGLDPDYSQNGNETWKSPLRGAEFVANADHSLEWAVSGHVTDSDTHQPIAHFRVIPGNTVRAWIQTTWDVRRGADGANGEYLTYLDKRWSEPLLQVRADGYIPEEISLLPLQQTNADVVLKKGSGPSGTVLLPDGTVAGGVGVMLVCAVDRDVGLGFAGELNPRRKEDRLTKTDAAGRFSFAPEVGMQFVVVDAPEGFKRVTMETLKTNSEIVLEAYGQIKGTLKRPSGPGTNETLDLAFADEISPVLARFQLSNRAHTDDQGRFEFDRVPPGRLQITYRQPIANSQGESWNNQPLQQVTLAPGQTLETNIVAPERAAREMTQAQPVEQPKPARIQGVQLKGHVLLPDGKPAAGAQVALQVTGKYLQLGKALLDTGGNPEDGLIVNTAFDGEFILPMFDGAKTVIAVNNEGFARVSLVEFKASPQLTLQPWGCIEGTLHIGRRLGTNQIVRFNFGGEMATGDSEPLIYDGNVFLAKTDDQGRFVMSYVPPGVHKLCRDVPLGGGSFQMQPIGSVDVKAGGVTKVSLGGTGENVIGKAKFTETAAPVNWKSVQGSIHTSYPEAYRRLGVMKTSEEQLAYQKTDEYKELLKKSMKDFQSYPTTFSDDGSFTANEVPPGKYEMDIAEIKMDGPPGTMPKPINMGHAEISIPQPAGKTSDAAVDLGVLELKPFKMPAMPASDAPTAGK